MFQCYDNVWIRDTNPEVNLMEEWGNKQKYNSCSDAKYNAMTSLVMTSLTAIPDVGK